MREIPLTQGKVALVSDEDYSYLSQFNWQATRNRKTFYAKRRKTPTTEKMHQAVALRMGLAPSIRVDHFDRDGLNNQRDNLRPATNKQNQENRGTQVNNKSGVTGVCWHTTTGKWLAKIKHNGKYIYLGVFVKLEDAAAARRRAEKEYWTHAKS